jgi:hypothetical protein
MITRFGGEGQTPEVDELLNAWAEMPAPDALTWEWMVRQHGEASVRRSIEALRATEGDDVADATLAEIDEAVAHIEAEDAFTALDDAMNALNVEIATARGTIDNHDDTIDVDLVALLEAAELVLDSWGRLRTVTTSPEAEAEAL